MKDTAKATGDSERLSETRLKVVTIRAALFVLPTLPLMLATAISHPGRQHKVLLGSKGFVGGGGGF